jgi:hypothetical protein
MVAHKVNIITMHSMMIYWYKGSVFFCHDGFVMLSEAVLSC